MALDNDDECNVSGDDNNDDDVNDDVDDNKYQKTTMAKNCPFIDFWSPKVSIYTY